MLNNFLLYILAIFIHETGHYIVARCYRQTVDDFAIFFNPWFDLLRFKIGQTTFHLGWLPIGGYVRVRNFDSLPEPKQFVIAIAGIVANHISMLVGLYLYGLNEFTLISGLIMVINSLPYPPYDGYYIRKMFK
ncbi:MAG: site-2 protease family protein [Bacteroidota bacterium]